MATNAADDDGIEMRVLMGWNTGSEQNKSSR